MHCMRAEYIEKGSQVRVRVRVRVRIEEVFVFDSNTLKRAAKTQA